MARVSAYNLVLYYMAKSFISISKGLSLLSFFTFGKYKDCRVDSIVTQDPKYIDFIRINYSIVFDKTVLEAVVCSHEFRNETQAKSAWKIKKYGIDGLFDNREYDEEYEQELVLLQDVPF